MGKWFPPQASTAERTGLTPDDGSIFYDEDEQTMYIGDGSTLGGNTLKGDTGPQGPPGTLTAVVDDLTPQLGGFLDPFGQFIGMDKGGDLASASPLVIGTDGDYFDVTGTTGFAVMTVASNRFFMLQFDAVLTITNGASIVIPGGVNFTTAVGDQLLCFSTATNTVRILGVTKADGTPVVIELSADLSPQLSGFLDPNGNYIGSGKGGDLASAASMVIGIDGDYFDVTGTTGFADFVVTNNRRFRLQFDDALTITVGSGIFLNNSGVNFTTAAGDEIDFQSIAANTVVGTITKADGTSPVSAGGFTEGTMLTPTGSTALFSSIPAGTRQIVISFNQLSMDTDDHFQIQIGDAGGIETSGYVSNYTSLANAAAINVNDHTPGFQMIRTGAAETSSGSVTLNLMDSATFLWSCVGHTSSFTSVVPDRGTFVSGIKTLSAELTQLQIKTNANLFDSGTVNIQYI